MGYATSLSSGAPGGVDAGAMASSLVRTDRRVVQTRLLYAGALTGEHTLGFLGPRPLGSGGHPQAERSLRGLASQVVGSTAVGA